MKTTKMPNNANWHSHSVDKPKNDNDYFEAMSRVIFMSGLNWKTLDKKWPGIKKAFANFDIDVVAKFEEPQIEELASNPEVIRNLSKINAIVGNAKVMQNIKKESGSFGQYLSKLRGEGGEDMLREELSKKFAFLGKGTTVIFLFSVGEDMPKAKEEWLKLHEH